MPTVFIMLHSSMADIFKLIEPEVVVVADVAVVAVAVALVAVVRALDVMHSMAASVGHPVRLNDDYMHSSVEHAMIHEAAGRLPVAAEHYHSTDDGQLVASAVLLSTEAHAAEAKSAKYSVLDL